MGAEMALLMDLDEGLLLLPVIIAGTLPYLAFAVLGKRSATARGFGAILATYGIGLAVLALSYHNKY